MPAPEPGSPPTRPSTWRDNAAAWCGSAARDLRSLWTSALEYTRRYFVDQDPTLSAAFAPALIVAALCFVRHPASNYIFDEQEALLANPYVNGNKLGFWSAFTRDFWGLPPGHSIGSYRPLPNLIWRLLWHVSEQPWLHHWANVVVHAATAALLASFVLVVTRRRRVSWLAGAVFLCAAVITEAVTGVVGLADVLGGFFALGVLHAQRLRLGWMALAALACSFLGMLSKESALAVIFPAAWAALVVAPALHPRAPRRALRAALTACVGIAGLIGYTYLRRKFFPVHSSQDLPVPVTANDPAPLRALHAFLDWFRQPRLPHDPINNPLSTADAGHRVAGALRVYWRGLEQVVFPWTLSGDYSYPAEPIPTRLVFPESVLGGLCMVVPPIAGLAVWVRALFRERTERSLALEAGRAFADDATAPAASAYRSPPAGGAPEDPSPAPAFWSSRLTAWCLVATALVWVPATYFPHSNIAVVLPTVRAERFWYLPVIGSSLALAVTFDTLLERANDAWRQWVVALLVAFLGFQALRARMHALDYSNDLAFWRAARNAVPRSAKAQLNYSVMLGARERLNDRLKYNEIAMNLAPEWPMARVYYGDTLCRLHRAAEAWPHFRRGFEMAPNDSNLIALGLQCLWTEKAYTPEIKNELLDLSREYPGSWLAYLGTEIVNHGEEHGGIEKKYRPRGYNEGPKD